MFTKVTYHVTSCYDNDATTLYIAFVALKKLYSFTKHAIVKECFLLDILDIHSFLTTNYTRVSEQNADSVRLVGRVYEGRCKV